MTRVTFGKSRVRESRMPGSVRAKAEWLSYSTTILSGASVAADPHHVAALAKHHAEEARNERGEGAHG